MSKVTTDRHIDIATLPFPAVMRGTDGAWEVEADISEADLASAVDSAADWTEPATPDARLVALEARIDAAAALAEQANTTAQDVAAAMKPTR